MAALQGQSLGQWVPSASCHPPPTAAPRAAGLPGHGSLPQTGQVPALALVLMWGTQPEMQPGTGWRLIISLYPPSCLALNKILAD